jgi:hypothetical protein
MPFRAGVPRRRLCGVGFRPTVSHDVRRSFGRSGPPPAGRRSPLRRAPAAFAEHALLQFGVAFRSGKIRFLDEHRIQKLAFDRLFFTDMRDDRVDRHRHLLKREFDRAI